jgi:SpoVK/Ycf46/Vps4 family AAA+-type ATPase
MSHKATVQIDHLIRARYPIIYVVSHEERRVETAVRAIAEAQGKPLFTWTASRGIRDQGGEAVTDQYGQEVGRENPIPALEWVAAYGTTDDNSMGDAALFLVKDLHPFFRDPVVVRMLRDLAGDLVSTQRTVILLSPTLDVPQACEKEIAVLDFPLPDVDELAGILDDSIDNLPGSVPVDLNGDGSKERVIKALRGLTAFEAESVLAMAVIATGKLDDSAVEFILNEKRQIVRKSGVLEYYPASEGYNDVGGLDLLKAYARQREFAFTDKAKEYGVEPPRGVLLVGVPGCGKSLTAKAIAGGRRPLLRMDVGALMGSLVGQSEANLRAALKVAEAVAPAVLWIDEVEKGLGGMSGGEFDGGTSKRVFGTLLTWMQEHNSGVYVVATANDVSALPPELLRRFDDIFFVDLPDRAARREIWEIHLAKRGRNPEGFDLETLTGESDGLTGSEIEETTKAALFQGFSEDREITTDDLLNAMGAKVPLSTTMAEKLAAIREWAGKRARPASSTAKATKTAVKAGRRLEL